ncbi:MAG: hypothetical protein KC646_04025 [Candidatus Cloacimonetes bacterium]|nr:hypothetical protein [Candidatus Cloacimonadota bacterium]
MKKILKITENWLQEDNDTHLELLKEHLDQSTADSLDLTNKILAMNKKISWDKVSLYECEDFHVSMLMIPKGKKIPLHTHPGMHVISKCVWGHFLISCYDWCEEFPFSGIAKQTANEIVNAATPACVLEPKKDNIHQIIALEDCAFINIETPPYDDEYRKISYLKVAEELSYKGQPLVKLEVTN